VVIQDMLRVFIIRIACQKIEYASLLLQPILCCIRNHLSDLTTSEIDAYKVLVSATTKFLFFTCIFYLFLFSLSGLQIS
jgi:hypothetical protein